MRFVFLITVLLFASQAYAYHTGSGFGCEVQQTACDLGDVCLFSISATENAHSSDCSAYDYKVCCNKFANASLKSSCSSGEVGILSISGTTGDAHIAEYYDPFAQQVCAVYDGTVACRYSTTQLTGYDCVVGMSSAINAHVGACDDTSGGALWCITKSVVEGHTLTVRMNGSSSDRIYIDNVGEKSFAQLTTQTYDESTKYLFGYQGNKFYGSVIADGIIVDSKTNKFVSSYATTVEPIAEGSKIFAFLTKGDLENIKATAEKVAENNEENVNQIYFGTVDKSDKRVTVGLQQSRYVTLQGSETLSPGTYELVIRGVDTTTDTEIIEVRKR